MGQSGGQATRVQLVKLDQLQQIVELGYTPVQSVQPAIASFVEHLSNEKGSLFFSPRSYLRRYLRVGSARGTPCRCTCTSTRTRPNCFCSPGRETLCNDKTILRLCFVDFARENQETYPSTEPWSLTIAAAMSLFNPLWNQGCNT